MQLLEALSHLQLQYLQNDWVQSIYDSEFFEFGYLPSEYQNAVDSSETKSILHNIILAIDDWLTCTENSKNDATWATLSLQLKHEKLLALLGYYINWGNKNILLTESRNNALWASRLYYKLLCIPGFKAYHIYHSQLFVHTLVCLTYPKSVCENEDNFFNPKQLISELNFIIKELSEFVYELKYVIENLQLKPGDMNFEDILSNLIDITGIAIVTKLNIDKIELANLSKVVYDVIDLILCDANGEPNALAIKILFKAILPKFLAASLYYKQANNIIRASYVAYSGLILSKYGKSALSSYVVLLQHLTYSLDGLEKAEVRQTRISLIISLLSLLPQRSYRSTVKWLLKLSTTAKVFHRQLAMELLAQLLPNDADQSSYSETDSHEKTEDIQGHDNKNPVASELEKDSDQSKVPTEDDSSQSQSSLSEDTSNEDISFLNQRRHCVPHGKIIRAIYEGLSDVSGTLRARAIVLLSDLLGSDHEPVKEAMRDLSGDGIQCQLAKSGFRCASDERAVVRKAAVSLIHRLLVKSPHPSHYATLVSLCRDASIVVRGAAINALADVALNNPTENSLNAFLTGPMHQLSDPEVKIQEQVISLAEAIIVTPLQKFDPCCTDECLPWSFVAGIIKLNMRKHLQKAFMLLVKSSNCINNRLIDLVKTHLGVLSDARDLQSLVLLTCVARQVEYNDLAFLLDYYYKLADTSQERQRDHRLMPLTVELLSLWSRYVEDESRRTLRDHLIKRLQSSYDADCRTAVVSLAAILDPKDLQWATDLMKLSERRALSGGSVDEWIRAADLSVIAPDPPSSALINLYITVLKAPPLEWSESERGACVAGIGRICIRLHEAAELAAPQLALLLQDPAAPLCVRLNSLIALTDICIRYTCIVEPLLQSICGCLNSDAPSKLRRAAARDLTRLLLGGYLRLRTPLYYRFCALLADEDLEVREPAEYYVTCCLTVDVIFHHFVDCVLHYNNDSEDRLSFDSRQLIYDVMLQRMSVVQRLNIQCRLAREVLTHAADEIEEIGDDEELPGPLNAALIDTITLLCGPRMKLPKKPDKSGEVDIDDLQERVTTNIVSHKMKRTVAEVLVPAVLRLYARLRTSGGQLITYIVKIATDLHNDYRQEIEELIEEDEDLVERVRQFQQTIGVEVSSGNARNLVTTSAPPEPDTPSNRKRSRPYTHSPRKRKLKI